MQSLDQKVGLLKRVASQFLDHGRGNWKGRLSQPHLEDAPAPAPELVGELVDGNGRRRRETPYPQVKLGHRDSQGQSQDPHAVYVAPSLWQYQLKLYSPRARRDHDSLDFGRTLPDAQDAVVPVEPFYDGVLHEAVATVNLHSGRP